MTLQHRLAILGLTAGLLATPLAFADHNSVWGEGWANMPNDIHNTRLDTLGEDSDTFLEFVQYGDGADSVNRYLEDGEDTSVGDGRAAMWMGDMGAQVDIDSRGVSALSVRATPADLEPVSAAGELRPAITMQGAMTPQVRPAR